jgi:tetratricopeptide (TPR) repeat protein
MNRLLILILAAFGMMATAASAETDHERLDNLFATLKAAPDHAAADAVASQIKRIWMHSGSDTADLLLERADTALAHQDIPLSIELLDRLVVLAPDWAEAWNRRATLFYLMDDYPRAMSDIAETLKREPRHYGAIAGMGLIFMQRGNKKLAYEAFERVLAIYPQLETAQKAVQELRTEIEGLPL